MSGSRLTCLRAPFSAASDQKQAIATRKKVFEQAARDNKLWVGGAHLSFPGIGHVRAAGSRSRIDQRRISGIAIL